MDKKGEEKIWIVWNSKEGGRRDGEERGNIQEFNHKDEKAFITNAFAFKIKGIKGRQQARTILTYYLHVYIYGKLNKEQDGMLKISSSSLLFTTKCNIRILLWDSRELEQINTKQTCSQQFLWRIYQHRQHYEQWSTNMAPLLNRQHISKRELN